MSDLRKEKTGDSGRRRQTARAAVASASLVLGLSHGMHASQIEDVLSASEDAIRENRTTLVTIKGRPGTPVRVRQQRHAFPFGTAIAWRPFFEDSGMDAADRQKYLEILAANFNSTVHENEAKWYHNEPQEGRITFEHADRMLAWCEERGMETRGHCVFWGVDQLVPSWQKALTDEDLLRRLRERARLVMSRYRGRIREWDVNNEMVHGQWYAGKLGWDIHNQMFHWCREDDPEALLYVNDYGILAGGSMDAYIEQIEGFIAAGVPLGGIGVQGHFGAGVNGPEVKARLDRLARFGLPIRVTEFDANVRDEDRKALALVTLYATAFAHPAVEGITMWGFWEGVHWRPNAALWNRDWTENKAGTWYRELVFKRWWTDWSGEIGPDGAVQVRVFYGDHEVTADGRQRRLTVRPGENPPLYVTENAP